MDPEVVQSVHDGVDRIGNPPDPHLNRRSVFDQPADVLSDRPLDLRRGLGSELGKRHVGLDDFRDSADVEERITQDAWHPLVHLGDDDLRVLARRARREHLDTEAHESVLVRRRQLHHRDVEGHDPFVEHPRNLMQEHRHVVRTAVIDRGAIGGTDEQRVVPEMPRHLRTGQGVFAQEQDVRELDVFELFVALRKRIDERARDRRIAAVVNAIAALDQASRIPGATELALVLFDPSQDVLLRLQVPSSSSRRAGCVPSAMAASSCTGLPRYR